MEIKGYAAYEAKGMLNPHSYEAPVLQADEVLVEITHCGICHSDLHLIDNDWGVSKYPFIPGHEIIGNIVTLGTEVNNRELGQRVGIGWQAGSCGSCFECQHHDENLCQKSQPTCVQRNGGYASHIVVKAHFAVPVPDGLDSMKAAPLLCAGVTVFNPIVESGVQPGDKAAVIGMGGLGHLAVQFLHHFGAEVTVFSHSANKEAEALSLGAQNFMASNVQDFRKNRNSFDFIMSTISQDDMPWSDIVAMLRPKGTLCLLGAPTSALNIQARELISGSKKICGSSVGSPLRIAETMAFAQEHGVQVYAEAIGIESVNMAIQRVREGKVRYRMVLENP